MIYNEDAYYTGYYRNVRAIKAVPALVFDTIVGLLRDPNNKTGEIANKTLQDMLGVSKQTVLDAINKIIEIGWIVRTNGDGRGNKSVYVLTEKGLKNVPFIEKKGSNNWTERVKKIDYKGQEIRPINKELNKELKESGGIVRETNDPTLSNTTPQNFENMEDFNLFCKLYPIDPDWSWRKDECANVWRYMNPEWRAKLIEQLQNGKRWRVRKDDDPFWYLKNYEGKDVQIDLPFIWNGDSKITKWLKAGEKVIVMLYQEGDKKGCIYCLEKDRGVMEVAGAKYLRNM